MNRGKMNCYDCSEQIDIYPEKPEKKEPKCKPCYQTETILKCGTVVGSAPVFGSSLPLAVSSLNSNGFQPQVQATVVLDTSELINPTVKLDFSSLISYKTTNEDNYCISLEFKLSKICDKSCIPLGTWRFVQSSNEGLNGAVSEQLQIDRFVQETNSFGFSWCECGDCPDCCRYIVELVDQQLYNVECLAISNVFLNALAVGKKKIHCRD
ncbi:MAG: DUF4489 domain-containing protein [Syntrophomonas sp.]|nr:DUF4489 domain-containing protein [Syntrophomonas sp.]